MAFLYDAQGNIIGKDSGKPKKKTIPAPAMLGGTPAAAPAVSTPTVSPPPAITGAGGRKAIPEAFSVKGVKGRFDPTEEERTTEFKRGLQEDVTRAKALGEVKTQQAAAQTGAVAKKEAGAKWRVAKFKLVQSGMYWDRMENWNKKNLPGYQTMIKTPGIRGPGRGMVNYIFGEKLRENPHVNTFKGDQKTTAMEFVRAIMPTRAAKLVEMVLETLPDTWSTAEEKDKQIVGALVSAIGTHFAHNPEDYPEISDSVPGSYSAFISGKEQEMREVLKMAREQAIAIPKEAKTPQGVMMVDADGNVETVPYSRFTEASMLGYKPINKNQFSEMRKQ